MRYVHIVPLVLAIALPAARANAQSFQFYPYDEENTSALNEVQIMKWANMARCLCDAWADGSDTATLNIRVRDSSGSYTTQEVYFFLGDDCDSEATAINDVCTELAVINHSNFNQEQTIRVPVHLVVNYLTGECTEQNGGTTTLYVIMGDPNNTPSATYTITYDTAPPGAPLDVSAQGGENAVTVAWDPPDSDSVTIQYYNVLCALNGAPLTSPRVDPSWTTTQEVCGQDLTPEDVTHNDAGVPDAAVPDATVSTDASPAPDASVVDAAAPVDAAAQADAGGTSIDCNSVSGGLSAGDKHPNPCFVCGTAGSTATDLRISGLQNDVVYDFAVVAIDEKGNVSAVSEVVSATPVLTTDFAEHYSAAGGAEEGGFCYIATAVYGDYGHPNVRTLRTYRDRVLARSAAGQELISWYYQNGPALVRMGRPLPQTSAVARLGLEGLVWISAQLTPGRGGADPQRAALPLGLLLVGLVIGLARLAGNRREDEEPMDEEPRSAAGGVGPEVRP